SAELSGFLDITAQIGATSPAQMELVLDFELPAGAYPDFGVQLSNSKGEQYRVGYNAAAKQFYSDRRNTGNISFSDKFARSNHSAPRLSEEKTIRMHLFLDAASAELFADGGATVLTDIFFPGEDFHQIALYSEKGSVKLLKAEAFRLRSIWR
ncbi:MAG TPA: GH32 C-terminal domain-containing protein, partial [Saprospiraceae bacterium]|nr:GH32 C-terminal domain-containing protein [Saprospiraceae bacterium]